MLLLVVLVSLLLLLLLSLLLVVVVVVVVAVTREVAQLYAHAEGRDAPRALVGFVRTAVPKYKSTSTTVQLRSTTAREL